MEEKKQAVSYEAVEVAIRRNMDNLIENMKFIIEGCKAKDMEIENLIESLKKKKEVEEKK